MRARKGVTMPEEEIEKQATKPDVEPIPGLGDPPDATDDEGDDTSRKGDGYVCMPADLVKE